MKKQIIALISLLAATSMLLCSCLFPTYDGNHVVGTVFPEQDTKYSSGATVTFDGQTRYFAEIGVAVTLANITIDKPVTLKLYQDWTYEDGIMQLKQRGACSEESLGATALVLDLNCHTINAGGFSSALTISQSGEGYKGSVTVQNGTIKGGSAEQGAGIAIDSTKCNITLKNLIVEQNSATVGGAGIDAAGSDYTLSLIGCTVKDNKCTVADSDDVSLGGGGIRIIAQKSSLVIQDCSISGNFTNGRGAGVYVYSDTLISVSGNVVINGNTLTNKYGTRGDNLTICQPYLLDYKTGSRFESFEGLLGTSVIGVNFCGGHGYFTERVDLADSAKILGIFKADEKNSIVNSERDTESEGNYGWYMVNEINDYFVVY